MSNDPNEFKVLKRGRPTTITPEIIEQIFEWVAQGNSENKFFDAPGTPGWSTWCFYKSKADRDFQDRYARAKSSCFQVWQRKLIDIATDESRDLQPDGKGGFKSDNTAVNRDRLKIDTMKWIMSKLESKVYGDKLDTTNESNISIKHENVVDRPTKETPEQWQIRVEQQMRARELAKTVQ